MGRANGEQQEVAVVRRGIVPTPPCHQQLSDLEQQLLEALCANEVPSWSVEQLNETIAAAFAASDEEQEWRHWSQHLLGTVRLRVDHGDLVKARELCDNYWPRMLSYKQTANGGNTTEKELWQAAANGQLSYDDVLAQRRTVAMTLATLDKERALRTARQEPIRELVEAIQAGDLDAARSAFDAIDSSRSIDEGAFQWAFETYKLFEQ